MGRWKFPLAMLAVAALLLWPETALNAGREAMRTWAASVAPALFPFLLLMPALTGAEAARAYEALLGRWMQPLLGLPGAAAPAVAVGMLAGSPAGAAAAVRTAKRTGMDARTLERLTGCVCGLGPGFLVSGIGASMLGSAADGRILLRSQLVAQTLMLLLSRRTAELQPTIADDASVEEEPVRAAVRATLSVCGYMAAFQMLAALLGRALRVPAAGMAALCLLDLPSGAKAVSALPMARGARLILLSAMTGFGGLLHCDAELRPVSSGGRAPACHSRRARRRRRDHGRRHGGAAELSAADGHFPWTDSGALRPLRRRFRAPGMVFQRQNFVS